MPTGCFIVFNHSDGIYNSGDTINGHVKLHTTKTKSIRGIYIKVKGYADVEWQERRSRTSNGKTEYYTVYYKGHEQYLNSVTYVTGQDCGDSFDLLPGIYVHEFSCVLPIELPTSCHETYGNIKYEVSVTIDRRFRFDNVFSKPFTVNHILDLNLSLVNNLPVSHNGRTEICCLCCCCGGGGEIHAELKVPFAGAIPGKKIPYQLFVYNDSNVDINNCKVKFKKVITFKSTTPSTKYKHISVDLDANLYESVLRLSRKEFKKFIKIPIDLPCTQRRKIINIEYYIKGKVYMDCCTSNIEIEIPITIGSIPFTEQTRDFNDEPVITIQPTAPTSNIMPECNSLPPVYNTLDLPTYDDAIQLLDHSDDERHNQNSNNKQSSSSKNNNFALPTAPPDHDNRSNIPNLSTAQIGASGSGVATTYGWL